MLLRIDTSIVASYWPATSTRKIVIWNVVAGIEAVGTVDLGVSYLGGDKV